jgi:hypothetical protein
MISPRWLPIPFAVLLLVWGSLGAGCVSSKTKLAAANNLYELQGAIDRQEDAQQKAIESLVKRSLELQRASLRFRWDAKRSELRLMVYQRFEETLARAKKELADQVNAALGPVEDRLAGQINAEAPRGAAGVERANALRLQLASTLAKVQRDTSAQEAGIEESILKQREEILRQVDEGFQKRPASLDASVSDADVSEVLSDYNKRTSEFRAQLKASTDGLRDFVTLEQPWQLLLKGVVGDSVYGLIEPKLSGKLDDQSAAVESTLDSLTNRLFQSLTDRLSSIGKKG